MAKYYVRSKGNPKLILTKNMRFLPEACIGPGAYGAKLFKTVDGASRHGTACLLEESL
jgi:hypothetical protein